jgi:opacity protein-like surface antigen
MYGGWTMYSGDLDVEEGGALLGGVRFTVNFGEDDRIGLDFQWGITRINFKVKDNIQLGNVAGEAKLRGEVTINQFLVGLTYRMTYLRLEYLTPFVRLGLGANYFDGTSGSGTFRPNNNGGLTATRQRIDSELGAVVQLGVGFDYKFDKNWSLRWEWSGDLMINDWADRDSPQFAGNVQIGVVWHFQ